MGYSWRKQISNFNSFFYKDSDIILIVFIITKGNTFNEAISFWITEINEFKLDYCFIYLVANFCEIDEAYTVSV